ncbi:hypothetical protein HMPREF9129_0939 [Peptoniphilus indolicus ATCC 29427]|uniref:Uncharacterized protein n=1 Tax=Peptoniphilus indolicus ATCC 29427 TaxID=997350 RepID=G4D3F9_9FIRM|nr:hypothetical protein HMPREF9129_0939 [Peptoniphilus indolicus ATCC 29427]
MSIVKKIPSLSNRITINFIFARIINTFYKFILYTIKQSVILKRIV